MSHPSVRVAPGVLLVRDCPTARAAALAVLFAALTGLGAQAAIRLPFTPVPVTLQLFFVLLSGAMLGSRLGALSQAQYLALGAAGLPVFAGGMSGIGAFAGPTAGYLVGFVAAAWVVGRLTERSGSPCAPVVLLAMLAGVLAVYTPGTAWLWVWLKISGGSWGGTLTQAVAAGALPFVGVDAVKAVLATAVVLPTLRRLSPKSSQP
ncbi:MAG: biotin transporter BioY [Armatimonadota bacterium]|nr:biotin transporter BioY [Armatimonadota bacterium]